MAKKRTKRTIKRSATDWAPRFLTALRDSGNIRHSCEQARVTRSNVYSRRDNDEAFRAQMSEAIEEATDSLELEARRRAYHGVDEPVIYQGELMGVWVDAAGQVVSKDSTGAKQIPLTIKKYSDTMLIFLLKGNRPEKYKENVHHEVTGKGGGPIRSKSETTHDISDRLREYLGVIDEAAQGPPGSQVGPDGTLQPLDTPAPLRTAGEVPGP
jgi:hypothetical protein